MNASRTTLSYAVLGLLSLRPMSAYELVQGYGRSLGQVMPRSEAAIYAEPKRLEAAGLVARADEQRGRRRVAVYTITDDGRDELAAWRHRASAYPQVDAEPVLRVVFADLDDPAALRTTIAAFRDEVDERILAGIGLMRGYLEGAGPHQDRADLVALSGGFVTELLVTYRRWCDWALDALDAWEDDPAARPEWAAEAFGEMVATLERLRR